jgi:hypothetical protein
MTSQRMCQCAECWAENEAVCLCFVASRDTLEQSRNCIPIPCPHQAGGKMPPDSAPLSWTNLQWNFPCVPYLGCKITLPPHASRLMPSSAVPCLHYALAAKGKASYKNFSSKSFSHLPCCTTILGNMSHISVQSQNQWQGNVK